MNTRFILMAQYGAMAIIPLELVCKDYFSHLTPRHFIEKAAKGEIKIPIVRMEASSQKAARGVHIDDLANWIDARREAAAKELKQMIG
ncbi:pyocin activator PrtN family protein [Methylosinus sp. KRF6]|uniref:pyocin activator PrtN family protein n=1 Tax=Methylosinus sp. KRF6 TaxID=2846853 RepID=UPI001C0B4C0D|nr:pyocin activator PrtN family protein [Methylosinus sp. KRF6]MBU3887625.1 pyocin activator PrtN family protein [Methylosinus sp. KRF6]